MIHTIPHLARLLEEKFGLPYWCNGKPLRPLKSSLVELAVEVGMSEDELRSFLASLAERCTTVLIDRMEFHEICRSPQVVVLNVSPALRPEHRACLPAYTIDLAENLFLDLEDSLRKAPAIIAVSNYGGRALSAGLALQDMGFCQARSLRAGAHGLM